MWHNSLCGADAGCLAIDYQSLRRPGRPHPWTRASAPGSSSVSGKLTRILSLSLSHTFTHTRSHSLTHTHTISLSLSHTHTHSCPLSPGSSSATSFSAPVRIRAEREKLNRVLGVSPGVKNEKTKEDAGVEKRGRRKIKLIRTSLCDTYAGTMSITTRLGHIGRCKTASSTN